MESMDSIVEKLNKGEIDEAEMEFIILLENIEIKHEDGKHKVVALTRSGMKELALKSNKFYEDKIKLFL